MKNVRDYQETMQKLYEAAMKYSDEKLAKAIGDVRDLVVEYKNIIDSYEINNKKQLLWRDDKMMRYYDVHFQIKDYGYSVFVMATTENEAVETITNDHLYQEPEDLDYIDYIDEITEQEYKEIKRK